MKIQSTHLLLAIATCLLVNACGTKGPLYIPEQQYPQEIPKDTQKDTSQETPKQK